MANQQWRNCRWCNGSYIDGNGKFKNLCSLKCQTQFYREYPNQMKADYDQELWDEKERKRKENEFYMWVFFILVGLGIYTIYHSITN